MCNLSFLISCFLSLATVLLSLGFDYLFGCSSDTHSFARVFKHDYGSHFVSLKVIERFDCFAGNDPLAVCSSYLFFFVSLGAYLCLCFWVAGETLRVDFETTRKWNTSEYH